MHILHTINFYQFIHFNIVTIGSWNLKNCLWIKYKLERDRDKHWQVGTGKPTEVSASIININISCLQEPTSELYYIPKSYLQS